MLLKYNVNFNIHVKFKGKITGEKYEGSPIEYAKMRNQVNAVNSIR